MINGRSLDLEAVDAAGIETLAGYTDSVGGALSVAAATILNGDITAPDIALVRASGRAWAMLGILRALPFQIQDNKSFSVTGAATQGFNGLSVQEMEIQLKSLTDAMRLFTIDEFAKAGARPASRHVYTILAQNKLGGLHLKALEKAGGSPFRMHEYECGNLKKLSVLTLYHLFQKP